MGFFNLLITIILLLLSGGYIEAYSGRDFHPDIAVLYTTNVQGEIEPCG